MSKVTAVITGRDFIKEVELSGSTSIVTVQEKLTRDFPGAHIQFFTGHSEIQIDHTAAGVWTEEELSTNQIIVEETHE
jgi:hypothetical protein